MVCKTWGPTSSVYAVTVVSGEKNMASSSGANVMAIAHKAHHTAFPHFACFALVII